MSPIHHRQVAFGLRQVEDGMWMVGICRKMGAFVRAVEPRIGESS